jgi:hypothetical protein
MNEILITIASVITIVVSVFLAFFLFWRACRHELFDNEQIFDIVLIGSVGGLFLGRVVGFLLNFEVYGLSFYKFFFFHVYPAFSFWGFVIGAFIAVSIFLRHKRTNVWSFFDLAAAPIIFGLFIDAFFNGLLGYFNTGFVYSSLVLAFFYFLFFFILKRLASKKRHIGFFACMFLVFCPIINGVYLIVTKSGIKTNVSDLYQLAVLFGVLLLGIFSWYKLAKRGLTTDAKLIFGLVFLRLLGFLRAVKSADEAGRASRTVIFSPYSILKGFLVLLRGLFREIKLGFVEIFYILGIRR